MQYAPAWYPDPTGLHDHRWWDGSLWTAHVADAGIASIDPLPIDSEATNEAALPRAVGKSEVSLKRPDLDLLPSATTELYVQTATRPDDLDEPAPSLTPRWQEAFSTTGDTAQQPPRHDNLAALPPDSGDADDMPATPATSLPAGIAAASLVLAAPSIPLAPIVIRLVPVGGVIAAIAVILAIIGLRRSRRGIGGGTSIAVGGLLAGLFGLALSGLLWSYYAEIRRSMDTCMEEIGNEAECEEALVKELTERFVPGR